DNRSVAHCGIRAVHILLDTQVPIPVLIQVWLRTRRIAAFPVVRQTVGITVNAAAAGPKGWVGVAAGPYGRTWPSPGAYVVDHASVRGIRPGHPIATACYACICSDIVENVVVRSDCTQLLRSKDARSGKAAIASDLQAARDRCSRT